MKKTCIIAVLLVIAILLINVIVKDTYSKYSSTGELEINGSTGIWVIEVNGQDITDTQGISKSFTIQSLNYSTSQYVNSNKIAPGLSGNFQIGINAENSDVAVKFDVILDLTEIEASGRINLASVKKMVNGIEEQDGIIQTDENTYTGTISLANIENKDTIVIQVNLEWPNDVTGANDILDSELGTDLSKTPIEIPVTVEVTQYLGETITQYTEV